MLFWQGPTLLNPHFANSMQGLVDAIEGSRYHLMFAQTGYSEMLDMDIVSSVLPFRPAGVVFTNVDQIGRAHV